MPKIDLPSGCWVEYRTELNGGDQFKVQGSFEVRVVDGVQVMPSNVQGHMRRALLAEIITGWGGPGLEGIPVPSQNMAGAAILDRLSIKDTNVLNEAVRPLLEEVSFTGPTKAQVATTPSSNSSPSS